MNKRARAALAAAHQAAQDTTLDTEIHSAASVLRVTPADLSHFDAQQQDTPPLDSKHARRLRTVIATASAGSRPEPLRSAPSFGELIRTARESAHLPLQTLAHRLHIHHTYLSGLESNTRSPLALGPDGARRLVSLLNLPPAIAAQSLRVSMQAALALTPSFAARMRRGMPRKERLKVLEAALPKTPDAEQERAWHSLIDAVSALDDQSDPNL